METSALFDETWYVRQYGAQVAPHEIEDAALHYLRHGEARGWRPHQLFDPAWYSGTHPDGGTSVINQLVHFELIGRHMGLAPSEAFDAKFYLSEYPDIAEAKLDPLTHYLAVGRLEGRLARHDQSPLSPGAWFAPTQMCSMVIDLGKDAASSAGDALFMGGLIDAWKIQKPGVLHLLHAGGGGTERRIRDIIALEEHKRQLVLFTERTSDGGWRVLLLDKLDGLWCALRLRANDAREFRKLIETLNIDRIHIHQAREVLGAIDDILLDLAVELEITVNDFSLLCPRDSFVTVTGAYCGEPDAAGCNECLVRRPLARASSIEAWRGSGQKLLRRAAVVNCPSIDTASRVRRYVPEARTIVSPPPDAWAASAEGDRTPRSFLTIAVIGALSIQKGGDFLLDCIEEAASRSLDVRWLIVGYFGGGVAARARRMGRRLEVTGAYRSDDLATILKEHDVDVIFFPQHCVETYSYALSEALASGRPVLAPALGPFIERTAGIDRCMLYPVADPPRAVLDRLLSWGRQRAADLPAI